MTLGNDADRPVVLERRRLFMILSPTALSYASLALKSLFKSAAEPIELSLVTDSFEDKQRLCAELLKIEPVNNSEHCWSVYSAADLDEREQSRFSRLEYLRGFRRGHPCWRKITDPLLLSNE